MAHGIYSITHRDTGAMYIGRSTNIEMRWHGHRHDVRRGRDKQPITKALREHGVDAFDFRILAVVPLDQLEFYERRFIQGYGTYAAQHYNRGGTVGGWPTEAERAAMPDYLRMHWETIARRSGAMGYPKIKELRKDPEYDLAYRAIKSAAGVKREANIKGRVATDPLYAAKEKGRRTRAAREGNERVRAEGREEAMREKASATFSARFETDAEYSARVSANRRVAAQKSNEAQRLLRQNPDYVEMQRLKQVERGQRMSEKHHARMESDPVYAAEYKAMRMRAGQSTRETFEGRRACQSSKT